MTPAEQLRHATAELRARLEAQPYTAALVEGTLPLGCYIGFLRAQRALHATVERLGATATDPRVRAAWPIGMGRTSLILHDLAELGADPWLAHAPVLRAELLAQRLRERAAADPATLVGALWALSGPPLGAVVQGAALAARPDTSGALAYLRACAAEFERPAAGLDRALVEPRDLEGAAAGAVELMAGLESVLAALAPTPPIPAPLVQELNPEAGAYRIPADLREIGAALRAGEESWRRCPYYAARYGERGRSFTRSDSAWLAGLGRVSSETALEQVGWLGRVLAARGMPRWLLEQHLLLLRDELAEALPERAPGYAVLAEAALALRAERERVLPPSRLLALDAEFAAAVGPELAARLPGAGALCAAAVADERCGVPGAVPSLVEWLADPARFPDAWLAAAADTIDAARAP